jgi:hypothetical protein
METSILSTRLGSSLGAVVRFCSYGIGAARYHPLMAAQARDDAKGRKYRHLSEQAGRLIVGAVMEGSGPVFMH